MKQFKTAVFGLYLAVASNKDLTMDDAILIDEVAHLAHVAHANEKTAVHTPWARDRQHTLKTRGPQVADIPRGDGDNAKEEGGAAADLSISPEASLRLTMRLRFVDVAEATAMLPMVERWVNGGVLQKALAEFNQNYEKIESIPVYVPAGNQQNIGTPTVYQQNKVHLVRGVKDTWVQVESTPFLMRQPPSTGNALDPFDAQWLPHNTTSLRTCWSGLRFLLPADDCVSNSSTLCPQVRPAWLTGVCVSSVTEVSWSAYVRLRGVRLLRPLPARR